MTQPLSEADILFPHLANTPNFSSTLSSLKRSTLSIHNRLTSIISDSGFVSSVAEAYQLPLVANERCGSWYIPSEKKTGGVYFKSTDGHMNQWGFSLRRLNLQLLDIVQKYGGSVIVDSTRRGKSMPDALSKTIPIWCYVINCAVFDDQKHALYTPPHAVSKSEHAQIENKLDGCVQQFLVCTMRSNFGVTHVLNRVGHLQTQTLRTPRKTQKAPPPDLGHSPVDTTRHRSHILRLPPHSSLHSITSCQRCGSI
jgi:tRNA A64-2'-O-ribosylphosphate transferase